MRRPIDLLAGAAPDAPVAPPEWIQLVPFGDWKGHPARPFSVRADVEGPQIVANFARKGIKLTGDYDHQTLRANDNGQRAPSSGWVDRVEIRDDGVWGHIEMWTDTAKAHIQAREYRYISPVLFFDWRDPESGKPRGMWVHSFALCNVPFFGELAPVAGSADPSDHQAPHVAGSAGSTTPGVSSMLLLLLASVGLPAEATEPQVKARLDEVKATRDAACAACGLPTTATDAELKAASSQVAAAADIGRTVLTELRLDAAKPAAELKPIVQAAVRHEGFISLAAHAEALAKAGPTVETPAQIVDAAIKAGKTTPAMREHWVALAEGQPAAVKAALAAAPVVIPLTTPITDPAKPDGLTAEDRAVCQQLGISPADYAAQRKGA